MTQRKVKERIMWNGWDDGRSRGREGGDKQKREGGIALATRPQSFRSVLKYLIDGSGIFPA